MSNLLFEHTTKAHGEYLVTNWYWDRCAGGFMLPCGLRRVKTTLSYGGATDS